MRNLTIPGLVLNLDFHCARIKNPAGIAGLTIVIVYFKNLEKRD